MDSDSSANASDEGRAMDARSVAEAIFEHLGDLKDGLTLLRLETNDGAQSEAVRGITERMSSTLDEIEVLVAMIRAPIWLER